MKKEHQKFFSRKKKPIKLEYHYQFLSNHEQIENKAIRFFKEIMKKKISGSISGTNMLLSQIKKEIRNHSGNISRKVK